MQKKMKIYQNLNVFTFPFLYYNADKWANDIKNIVSSAEAILKWP